MSGDLLENFISRLDAFSSWGGAKQVDYFAFYLMTEGNQESFTATDIQKCFDGLSLRQYARTASYLSDGSGKRTGKYIKSKKGYRLERKTFDSIKQHITDEPQKVCVSKQLADLVGKIKDPQEQSFLRESIDCHRVSANRATIILVWILTMDHLQKYIFAERLQSFNVALGKNPDRKVAKIVEYDDFLNLPESKFIEIARSAQIITNDVRKILDEKLGIRNSAAHPSGIIFGAHKATEFVIDLINNVILKY